MNLTNLYQNQENLFVLISALVIAKAFKTNNTFSSYIEHVLSHKRRLQLILISLFSGVLPVEGRISVTLPLYESIDGNSCCGPTKQMGIVSYLATHHYYLWSPLEKSVIILMAGLNLTYLEFLSYTYPFLLVYLLYLTTYIVLKIEERGTVYADLPMKNWTSILILIPFIMGIVLSIVFPTYYVFPVVAIFYLGYYKMPILKTFKTLNWPLVAQVAAIISIANVITHNASYIENLVKIQDTGSVFVIATIMLLAITSSLALGSSSKYAGITVAMCAIIGKAFFPIIFALEYCGYLLSPVHKCTIIAHRAFKTPLVEFYSVLLGLAICLISTGIITTLIK